MLINAADPRQLHRVMRCLKVVIYIFRCFEPHLHARRLQLNLRIVFTLHSVPRALAITLPRFTQHAAILDVVTSVD